MNRFYVAAQTGLILLFAAAVFVMPPAVPPASEALRLAGLVLCGVGLAIIVAALSAMGRVMQVAPEPKADGHLITRGVYRWLRHPMYTGMTLIVIGLALRQPTLYVIVSGVALFALLLAKSRFEERLLTARYPDYDTYRRRTWGVVPPIR